MKTFTTTTVRVGKLHEELLGSALPAAVKEALRVESVGEQVTVYVPDEAVDADVQAVIAAHDPTTPGIVEADDGERTAAAGDLAQQYQAALTRLQQIIDFSGTPTQAQVYDAVQDIALYLRKTLRYLAAQR